MKKVYPFTNENLSEYKRFFSFEGARIVSVVGSGDQYFASILNGAREVELYDINENACHYFILKFYAIQRLSYEDFICFFFCDLDNIEYDTKLKREMYDRLRYFLPNATKKFFDRIFKTKRGIQKLFIKEWMKYFFYNKENYIHTGKYIPYLDPGGYVNLQRLLNNRTLPTIYISDIRSMPYILSNKEFDILLTSNIFDFICDETEEINIEMYKRLLENFNCKEVQAYYSWISNALVSRIFNNYGFEVNRVPGVEPEVCEENEVIILRREK